jgi:signal peptidase I
MELAPDEQKPAEAPPRLSRARFIYYVCILIVCLFLLYFLVIKDMRFFLVPSMSMEPALHPRDHILTLSEAAYERGDVVVVKDPTSRGDYVVKRIAGLEGDEIQIYGNALFINGGYASEPYMNEPINYDFPPHDPFSTPPPYVVPEGRVFLLGDNRNFSEDSSQWNPPSVAVSEIIGKVRYIYLPLERFGAVRSYPLTNVRGE